MAYCAQVDILEQISKVELIQLSDDANAGVVDESVVTRGIADADAEIDGYCGNRYSVPFIPVPELVRKLSVDIAVYNLYSRRQGAPEGRKERYDAAVQFLRYVADGKAVLPDDAVPESVFDRVSLSGPARVFSRETLRGF